MQQEEEINNKNINKNPQNIQNLNENLQGNKKIGVDIKNILNDNNDQANSISSILDQASSFARSINYSKNEKKIAPKRKQKEKGDIASLVDEFMKNGIRDTDSIYVSLKNSNPKATREEAEFYAQIIRYSILNVKYSLNDMLGGKTFSYFMSSGGFKKFYSFVFTNDKLFWLSRINEVIRSKKEYNDLLTCLNFQEQTINLQTIAVAQTENYESGYFRDYNYQFSCIYTDYIGKDALKKAISDSNEKGVIQDINYTKFSFTFENVKYIYAIFDTGESIIVSDKEASKLDELCNNMNRYNSRKEMIEGKLKIVTVRKSSSCYLSQEVKLSDFCPCILIFNNIVPYSFSFNMDFNMDLLEDFLYKKFYENYGEEIKKQELVGASIRDYIIIDNLVTWDSMDLFVNFLIIESATKLKGKSFSNLRENINKFIEEYKNIKKSFNNAKLVITKLLNLLVRFFSSFQNRINTDIIVKIRDEYNKLRIKFKDYERQNCFTDVENILTDYNLEKICLTIYNSVQGDAKKIKDIIVLLDSFFDYFVEKDGTQIINSLKRLAVSIFSLFAVTDNDQQLINKVISPSVFLGNFLGGEDNFSNLLVKKMNDQVRLEIDENLGDIEYAKRIGEIKIEDAKEYALQSYLAKASSIDVFDDKSEAYNVALETIRNFGGFNEETLNTIIALGRTYLANEEEIPLDAFTEALSDEEIGELKNFLEAFLNKVKQTKAFKELAVANLNEEVIKLKSNINENLVSPINGPVELEDMEGLDIKIIDTEYLESDLAEGIEDLRYKGITDDVITDYLKKKYEVRDLMDIYDYEAPSDEDIKSLVALTSSKWGPYGTDYINYLKRLKTDYTRKMRLQDEANKGKKKRKVMYLKSIGRFKKKLGEKNEKNEKKNKQMLNKRKKRNQKYREDREKKQKKRDDKKEDQKEEKDKKMDINN